MSESATPAVPPIEAALEAVGESMKPTPDQKLADLRQRKDELEEELGEVEEQLLASEIDKAVQVQAKRMKQTCTQAAMAAGRLLRARQAKLGAGIATPSDGAQLMDLIDHLAKQPRKWGVFLSPGDKKALRIWHAYRRDQLRRVDFIKSKIVP